MVAKIYNFSPALWIHSSRLWKSVTKTWAAWGSASDVWGKDNDQPRSVTLRDCLLNLIYIYG